MVLLSKDKKQILNLDYVISGIYKTYHEYHMLEFETASTSSCKKVSFYYDTKEEAIQVLEDIIELIGGVI
jgi:hypothetical protein